jgi:hypothetical protein
MKAKRETVAAVIAVGVLLGGGGAAAAGIVGVMPDPGVSAPARAHQPAQGRIDGKFERVGGPIQPGTLKTPVVPLSGTMRFARPSHDPVSVRVGKNGVFSVLLAPGVYRVSGRTPDIASEPGNVPATCSLPRSVRINAGATRHVTVVCAVP